MDFKDRDFSEIVNEAEWHEFFGTSFALLLSEITPEQWSSITKQSTVRDFINRQHVERTNYNKQRELTVKYAVKGCRGLTPRIVREQLHMKWPWAQDPENEEITFDSHETMIKLFQHLVSKSSRLNAAIVKIVLPAEEIINEEDDAVEREKKIS